MHSNDALTRERGTTQPWRLALTQWGDALWGLALLLHDDFAAAQTATVQACVHALATPPTDAQTALFGALLQSGRRSPRLFRRRRMLPRALRRSASREVVMLAMWLLLIVVGRRLASLG